MDTILLIYLQTLFKFWKLTNECLFLVQDPTLYLVLMCPWFPPICISRNSYLVGLEWVPGKFLFQKLLCEDKDVICLLSLHPQHLGGQHKQWLHQHAEQICNGAGPYGVFLGQIPTLPLAPESSACLLSVEKLSLPGLPRATKAWLKN